MQKQKYLLESVSDQTDILQLYGIDESTVVDLFLLLNEQSSFLVAQNNIAHAEVLIEHALVLCSQVPARLQSALYSNMSCLFER